MGRLTVFRRLDANQYLIRSNVKEIGARRWAPHTGRFGGCDARGRCDDEKGSEHIAAVVGQALDAMVRSHLSGLPVIDETGLLVGIVSEADVLRRWEIGAQETRQT